MTCEPEPQPHPAMVLRESRGRPLGSKAGSVEALDGPLEASKEEASSVKTTDEQLGSFYSLRPLAKPSYSEVRILSPPHLCLRVVECCPQGVGSEARAPVEL
eukprot:1152286-Pelagomonas_calceolata.AAC.6